MAKRNSVKEVHQTCSACEKANYLAHEDFTFCKICGGAVISKHRPPFKICPLCAIKEHICEQCGAPLDP